MLDKGILALSFDDGRKDNYTVINTVCKKYNIPVTINITTGYVDKSCEKSLWPTDKEALSIEEVRSLANDPLVEVALHGDQHLNTFQDIKAGRDKLSKWLNYPQDHIFGLASPSCRANLDAFRKAHDDSVLNLMYLRTGLRIVTKGYLRTISRKISRITHIPLFYVTAYKETIMYECSDRVLYSILVLKTITVEEIYAIIEYCQKTKGALILTFHSIEEDTKSSDNFSWGINKFEQLCQYLNQASENGKINLTTTADLFSKISREI